MAKVPYTAAREFITPSEQSLLEDYGVTSTEFNRVAEPENQMTKEDFEERSDGSENIESDRSGFEPGSPGNAAIDQDVDRETLDLEWAEEQQYGYDEALEQDIEFEPDLE